MVFARVYFTDQDNTEVDVENSILVSKLPRVKNKTIWPLGTNSMHRLTPAELEKQLKIFFKISNAPAILEIFTPYDVNDKVLLDYFESF